jgi:hypothetical protein
MQKYRWLLPTPAPNGWHDAPLSTSEATKWLRALLSGFGHTALQDIGTHSLKCTCLAWAASWGLDLETRSLLGSHVPHEGMSAITYSRVAQAHPLRKLDEILRAIRLKQFLPDSTRSGRFPKSSAQLPVVSEIEHEEPNFDAEGFVLLKQP